MTDLHMLGNSFCEFGLNQLSNPTTKINTFYTASHTNRGFMFILWSILEYLCNVQLSNSF